MNPRMPFLLGAALAGAAASASHASLPTYRLNWLVNGQESVIVNQGDLVLVTGIASWDPPTHGFGSTMMRVTLDDADASDGLAYSELSGLGRNPLFRLLPQSFQDDPMPGGWTVTGLGNTPIDAAQLPQFVNPFYTPANPVEIFRFEFTAGDAGRSIWVDSPIDAVNLYADALGTPAEPYMIEVDGARIEIVPAPNALALVGAGGLVALRRRRRR